MSMYIINKKSRFFNTLRTKIKIKVSIHVVPKYTPKDVL